MKNKRTHIISIVTIAAVVMAGVLFFMNFSVGNKQYIAKRNGEHILVSEYMIFLREQRLAFEYTGGSDIWDTNFDGESAFAIAKQNALDSIVYIKTIAELAPEFGILLSEEELAQSVTLAEEYYSNLDESEKSSISPEDVKTVMRETQLYEKINEDAGLMAKVNEKYNSVKANIKVEKNAEVWNRIPVFE